MSFLAIVVVLLLLVGISGATVDAVGQSLTTQPNPTNETGVNVYQSSESITGYVITNDPHTWPGGDAVWNICAAVAYAEGYNRGTGTAPYDLNNPGDLGPGDEHGFSTAGGPQWHDGSNIICFATAEDGWSALYAKFTNIIRGNSSVYKSSDTWLAIAKKYAGNWQPWVSNVTSYLGVDENSTPLQYVNSSPQV